MAIVTLLTDLGYRDPYLAMAKGKLLSGIKDLQIIDISHDIIMLICLLLKLSNISLSLIVSLLTKHIIHFINNQYV